MKPPNIKESYIHRSGRTGRAGNKGKCITFYTSMEERDMKDIEMHIKQKIPEGKRPTVEELKEYSENEMINSFSNVNDKAANDYESISIKLLEIYKPEEALSRALAIINGNESGFQERGLISGILDNKTFKVEGEFRENHTNFPFYQIFNNFISREDSYKFNYIYKIKNNKGYVFEIKKTNVDFFLPIFKQINEENFSISECQELPELIENDNRRNFDNFQKGNRHINQNDRDFKRSNRNDDYNGKNNRDFRRSDRYNDYSFRNSRNNRFSSNNYSYMKSFENKTLLNTLSKQLKSNSSMNNMRLGTEIGEIAGFTQKNKICPKQIKLGFLSLF